MDAEILSRIQFGFTIAFHIMFPALSIGFVWLLVFMEAAWHRTGNERWIQLYRFWAKIFALCFGLGVVSGLVMSYEIGTNFAGLSKVAGSVLGPLLSSEVLTAFFIEAGFLGVMLFGWKRVGPKLHFLATFLVAFGTTSSAFWILTANSWMQTPAGAKLVDGRFVPENWLQIIFNPSMPYRFSHMMLAAILTAHWYWPGYRPGWFCARSTIKIWPSSGCAWACGRWRFSRRCRSSSAIRAVWRFCIISRPSWRRSRPTGRPRVTCPCCCSPGRTPRSRRTCSRSAFPTAPA
jgi:cytochrome bd quinol oxidase subunit 1 apoprotein (EC 1.10.3.-)